MSFELWQQEWERQNDRRTYSNHVSKFVNYLKYVGKENTPLAVKKEDIIGCVGYYNNLNNINTVETLKIHLESLKSFFSYLQKESKINNIFNDISDYQVFQKEIIEKFNLRDKQKRPAFSEDEIIKILKTFENPKFNLDYNDQSEKCKEDYRRDLGVYLFVRLNLLYPASRQDICNLKVKNFYDDYFRLHIKNKYTDGFDLDIPSQLRKIIKQSITQREIEIGRKVDPDEELLSFILGDEFRGESINEWLFKFLKKYDIMNFEGSRKKTFSAGAIKEFTISKLLDNGVNPILISKIANLSVPTVVSRYNQTIMDEDESMLINLEISRMRFNNLF